MNYDGPYQAVHYKICGEVVKMGMFVESKEVLLDRWDKMVSLKYVYEYEDDTKSSSSPSSNSDSSKTVWILF